MSVLLFKRFLARPFQVAYIVPSSHTLVKKVAAKVDFSKPRILVELGPGEGCHTREIVAQMHPDSRLLLFEIDPVLAEFLRKQFADDSRVEVIETDAAWLKEELAARGLSGLPFSMFDVPTKRRILHAVYESLAPLPHASFVIYQCTHELRRHATMFARVEFEFCLRNMPPIFVFVYHKLALNGHARATGGACCCDGAKEHHPHGVNGHGKAVAKV
jgi:phospholipid N-methyltransferase